MGFVEVMELRALARRSATSMPMGRDTDGERDSMYFDDASEGAGAGLLFADTLARTGGTEAAIEDATDSETGSSRTMSSSLTGLLMFLRRASGAKWDSSPMRKPAGERE